MDQPQDDGTTSYDTLKLKVIGTQIVCNNDQFPLQRPQKSAAAKRSALARRRAKEHVYYLQKSRQDLQKDNDRCLSCIKQLEKEYEELAKEVSRYHDQIRNISIVPEDMTSLECPIKSENHQKQSTVTHSSSILSPTCAGSEDCGNVSFL